jgi:hypothetical protein
MNVRGGACSINLRDEKSIKTLVEEPEVIKKLRYRSMKNILL